MYLDHIWRLHGSPLQVICDRDPRLVSEFFRDFARLTGGTKPTPTTAFHPQGDGQSENTNKTMEQILRSLVEPRSRDWDKALSQVEFAINDSVHKVTGYTPFEMMYGETVSSPGDWVLLAQRAGGGPGWAGCWTTSYAAQHRAEEIRVMVRRTRELMARANEAAVAADARKPTNQDVYEVGDSVLLSTKTLTTVSDRGTKVKLRRPYCGPFRVTEVYMTSRGNPHAYRLQMPPQWRLHPVFKGSRL